MVINLKASEKMRAISEQNSALYEKKIRFADTQEQILNIYGFVFNSICLE
jgi:hypothetical protein